MAKRWQRGSRWLVHYSGDTADEVVAQAAELLGNHIARGQRKRGFKSCERLAWPVNSFELTTHRDISYNAVFSALVLAVQSNDNVKNSGFKLELVSDTAGAAIKRKKKNKKASPSASAGKAAAAEGLRGQRCSHWLIVWEAPETIVDIFHTHILDHIARGKRTRGFKSCERLSGKAVVLETHKTASYNAVASALLLVSKRDSKLRKYWYDLVAQPEKEKGVAATASQAQEEDTAAPPAPKRSRKPRNTRAQSKPRSTAGHGRAIQLCVQELKEKGYSVREKAVPQVDVTALVAVIRRRVCDVLAMYGKECSPDCSELMENSSLWSKSPAGWADKGEKPFWEHEQKRLHQKCRVRQDV